VCIVTLDLVAVKLIVTQLLVGCGSRLKTLKYHACSPETLQILKLGAGVKVKEQRLKTLLHTETHTPLTTVSYLYKP